MTALFNLFIKFAIISVLSVACSNAGEVDTSATDSSTSVNLNSTTLSGIIKGPSGSQTELSGWIIGFSEIDTQVVHVGVISAVGHYQVGGVNTNAAQTMFLLTDSYELKAVLSSAGSTSTQLYQYFTVQSETMPTITYSSKTLSFDQGTTLSWSGSQVVDANSDLVPDGLDSFALHSAMSSTEESLNLLLTTDLDLDGEQDITDYDVDGDGLANWMDTDDDNDSIVDWLDSDANGDGVLDATEMYNERSFDYGLASFSVQFIYKQVVGNGSPDSWTREMIFKAESHSSAAADSVSILGSDNLFENSLKYVVDTDDTTADTTTAWDMNLVDDGLNQDDSSEDGTFGAHVVLDAAAVIGTNEAVFFSATSGTDNYQFGFVIPTLTINTFSSSATTSSRTIVAYSGTQPIDTTTMYWYARIYSSDGSLKHQSSAVSDLSETTYVVPDSVTLESGDYAKLVFYSVGHGQSTPSVLVESDNITFN